MPIAQPGIDVVADAPAWNVRGHPIIRRELTVHDGFLSYMREKSELARSDLEASATARHAAVLKFAIVEHLAMSLDSGI